MKNYNSTLYLSYSSVKLRFPSRPVSVEIHRPHLAPVTPPPSSPDGQVGCEDDYYKKK